MTRMTNQNQQNIRRRFEETTGVELTVRRRPVRKLAVIAAAMICCFALAAFTYPLFTPLDGDELTLAATYEGNGIISVYVRNDSDKNLEFQKQTKLMNWGSSAEVERLEGVILFENTKFPAHSSGTMIVDISRAYDIEALEMGGRNFQSYYLLLTNNDFLFGHDWMCSFTFEDKERESPYETNPHVAAEAENMAEIEEALQFYFEDSYQDDTMAWNENNFTYLQKVDEMIKRFEGNVIAPVYPMIMVSGPSTFLDPQPKIREEWETVSSDWTPLDGYRRLIGSTVSEKALTVSVRIPSLQYPDSFSLVPLIYTFVFEADAVRPDSYAFIYGQFRSFEELENCKVYEDRHYSIYDVTEYLYTDLDAYITYIRETREDLMVDDEVRQRIHEVYDHYRENLTIEYPAVEDGSSVP